MIKRGRPPRPWTSRAAVAVSLPLVLAGAAAGPVHAQRAAQPNWSALEATLKGNGSRRPLLLMAHTDVVTAVPERWQFPPFSATRDGGYVYGRGAVDDKDNVVASLMVMLMLKRINVPLDRDVVFLAESGEEGTTWVGIEPMVDGHLPAIAPEHCLAEGGNVRRQDGRIRFASIATLEKIPRTVELTARGTSGHGSVPLPSNAVVRLARAIAAIGAWEAPIRLNETTREYFARLARISPPEEAARFEALLSADPERVRAAVAHFAEHAPAYAAMVRTSVSPTIVEGGNRSNVIPSEARATLDMRILPDEQPEEVLELLRRTVNDPAVEVAFARSRGRPRPPGGTSIDTDAFRAIEAAVTKHYSTVTIPTLMTAATDAAYVRAMRTNCYGVGPLLDVEDTMRGFAAHGDQERILEAELHRFLKFYWDVVLGIAASR